MKESSTLGTGLLTLPGTSVLPLLRERPVHAYELSDLPGAQRPGVLVPCAPALEQRVEVARPARRPVVGHDPLDRDAELIEELQEYLNPTALAALEETLPDLEISSR